MNIVNFLENSKFGFAEKKNYDAVIKRLASLTVTNVKNDSEDLVEVGSISMACKFSKIGYENLLAVANEDGKIVIENSSNRQNPTKQSLFCSFGAHNNAVFDMSWCDVDYKLVVGSGDHSVSLWDISHNSANVIGVFAEHSKSVKSVCFVPQEKFLFASGARDGLILLWDARISSNAAKIKPFNSIKSYNWHSPGPDLSKGRIRKAATSADSISALLFQDNKTLFSCSVGEGRIKVWDIRKYYSAYKRIPQPVYTMTHPAGSNKSCFTSLALDPNGVKLYANCVDHSVYCYNVSAYSSLPVSTFTGHKVFSFYIKCSLSPDGVYLVSGSSDNKAYIWRTDKPGKPIVSLSGHSSEVTCVDWASSSATEIATCSDDVPADSNCTIAMVWEVLSDDVKGMLLSGDSDSSCNHLKCIGWAEEIVENPQKIHRKIITPRRFKPVLPVNEDCSSPSTLINSPTSNLPNYVIDGTSPHHQCSSARQKEKENRNWLLDLKNKTPPTVNISPRTGQKRPRQHNSKVCGNLLKFFKVSAKQNTLTPCNQISNNGKNSSPPKC